MNLVFASGFLVPQRILHLDYFRDLPARFPDAIFPEVPVDAHIRERAPILAEAISQSFPSGPVHVIAHSMGGLDTRYILAKNLLGLAKRIVSLQTVSTPHRGSPIADLLLGLAPDIDSAPVERLLDSFASIGSGALDDLSTPAAQKFNQENPDVPGVTYLSVFGTGPISLALKPAHAVIASRGNTEDERINDGIVSLASAKWPTDLTESLWPADHLAQIGHNLDTLDLRSAFDHKAAFDRLVQRASHIEAKAAAGGSLN